MPYTYIHPMHPGFGLIGILIAWLVQLVIGWFVYRDAKQQKMNAPLWFILVIIPFFGYLIAVLYLIIREVRTPLEAGKTPIDILKERFAEGRISAEEYEQGKEILLK
jgi:putative membrane protein